MVHNGIEYGDMQLIAEAYDVLRRGLGCRRRETADVFDRWNEGPLESFLVELTAQVCRVDRSARPGSRSSISCSTRPGRRAPASGRRRSRSISAVAIPTIAAAIDARVMSSMKDGARRGVRGAGRAVARRARSAPTTAQRVIDDLRDALYAARICTYAQGMALIRAGSAQYNWNIDLAEIARIWKGGCIIRARLLDLVRRRSRRTPTLVNLLLDDALGDAVEAAQAGWRRTVGRAAAGRHPGAGARAALALFRLLPIAAAAAEPDAGAARRVRRAHVRAHRSPRHGAQRLGVSDHLG